MSKELQIAYAAGLFDGEGTVTLGRGSNPKAFRRIQLSVSSTDQCLCEVFLELFGFGHIQTKTHRLPDKWSQAYEYRVTGVKALEALSIIYPYVRCPKKKSRIELLVSKYFSVTKRNGKYSEKELEAKHQFELDFFSL